MEKMTFREAQLCVLGIAHEKDCVELNKLQRFHIGDCIEVIEIRLDGPHIVVRIAEGPESYMPVSALSERVIDECVETLRDVAMLLDSGDVRRPE